MRNRLSTVAAGLLVPLLLAGCGTSSGTDDTKDTEGKAEETTREVSHELGKATVPTKPEAVVALDEVAGLTLLSLNIKPDVVYQASAQPRAQEILAAHDVELRKVTVGETPPLEKLAKDNPDLMVGTGAEGPVGVNHKDLSKLAPTVVLPIEGEWREIVTKTAEIFAEEELGKRQVAATEQVLKKATDAQEDIRVLSLLGNSFGANNFTMPPHVPISTLIKEAGFTRPEFQQKKVDGYSVPLSAEYLPEQDGDLLVIPQGDFYDAKAIQKQPTFKSLEGEVVTPDADVWFGMSGFAFFASAYDLEVLASEEGDLSSSKNIQQIWKAYMDATEK